MKEVVRWIAIAIAALLVGPLTALIVGAVRAPDGGPDATMLLSGSIVIGVLATLAALVIAGATGAAAARVLGVRTGYLVTGIVLIWSDFASGTVQGVLVWTQDGGALWRLATEGFVLGTAAIAMAWVINQVGKKEDESELGAGRGAESRSKASTMLAMAAMIVVGGVVAYLVAREGLKGQTLAAAAIGALAGATVASVVGHGVSSVWFFAGMAALAVVGPALGAVLQGGEAVARAYANELFPLAWMSPLDWVAGAFLGIPVGMVWGGSMLEKRAEV